MPDTPDGTPPMMMMRMVTMLIMMTMMTNTAGIQAVVVAVASKERVAAVGPGDLGEVLMMAMKMVMLITEMMTKTMPGMHRAAQN